MLAIFSARPARCLALLIAVLVGCAGAKTARAQVGSARYSSIIVDTAGNVLSATNPDDLRFPASLTKMMTLYMLFEAIRDHRISLGQDVPVSENAASMPPTKLGLRPEGFITVEQCILGLVTRSANDAAAALGELMGGDEGRFAEMMTLRAHALGMTRTTFRNASGLPDWNQVTTARDMATLARHLIQDFPEEYHYFSTPYFIYGSHVVRSHQAMLVTYPGADGLKTGYTEASGYNLATSAVHGDTRLIGIILGASNSGERNAQMSLLLDQAFERLGVAPELMARRAPPPTYAMIERDVPGRMVLHGRRRLIGSVQLRAAGPRRQLRAEPRGRTLPAATIRPPPQFRAAAQYQALRPARPAHGLPAVRYPG